MNIPVLDAGTTLIGKARHHDLFSILGRHHLGDETVIHAFLPEVIEVSVVEGNLAMSRIPGTDLFEWCGDGGNLPDLILTQIEIQDVAADILSLRTAP